MDVTDDTAPTATICLPGGPDHSTGGEDIVSMSLTPSTVPPSFNAPPEDLSSPQSAPMGVLELFMLSPSTGSTNCFGRSIDVQPRLLTEAHKVFNDVPTTSAFVPWPPPSCTRARSPLIYGHDLFQHAQQKHGKEFFVKDSQGKLNANWIYMSEDRHPFERMKVVKLKPPWPHSLGVCTNLPMGNLLSLFGSITFNDNSSPYASWCLDDVLWKLPKCWPDPPCAQPCWPDPPWPPPTPNRSTACRNSNLHSALNIRQTSGDCQVLKGVELKLWPALLVSIFVPGVQSAQLQPTVFRWSVAFSDMTLAVTSAVADLLANGLFTDISSHNGNNDHLEPVLRLIIKFFSRSPHFKWPPVSLNGTFLISVVDHQEFMGMYSVTAVLSRFFIVVLMRTEAMLWTIFQFATGDQILLLPFDPGLPLSAVDTMFSTLVDGIAVGLRSSGEATCLQGISIHKLFCYRFVVELIKKGMVALEELQPWTSWERPILIQWSILIVDFFCNYHWLVHSGNLFEFKFNEKNRQCSNFIILMSEGAIHYDSACFAWEIAWLLVGTSYACSGFGGREFVTSMSMPLDVLLQDWLSCLMGHIIQCGCDLLQWKIAWSLNGECLEIAHSTSKELLLRHMGEIFQANFLVSCYWLSDVAIGYMFCARFNHTRAYFLLVDMKPKDKDMNSWDYPIASAGCELIFSCTFPMVFPFIGDPGISAGIKMLQFPWDPGDRFASAWREDNSGRVDDGFYWSRIDTSQVPWVPGGLLGDRLGGKPILRGEDCQRPVYNNYSMGRHLGPWPAWEPDAEEARRHIYQQSGHNETWLGTERTRRLRPRASAG